MGVGIWSMHYIGMLAFSLPVPALYDWPTVLLSLIAAIFASAVALFVVSRKKMGWPRALAGSVFMGGGIATMHYTFATYFSTLTTGVLTLGLHGLAFLGGWIEQFGAITQTQRAVNVGVIASVLMPSEALWRRAAFEMQSPLASAMRISPFSTLSVPSTAMIFYAAIYLTIALVIAIRRFSQRDF